MAVPSGAQSSGAGRWVFACMLLGLVCQATGQAAGAMTPVSTPEEFMGALKDPTVAQIAVMHPMQLPADFGPVTISRQLLITSPFRVIIDWCDKQCNAGKVSKPMIILAPGALVTFNRLFFRNFIPHSKAALSNPALDFMNSPVPFVVSQGGQATFNLVVMHWRPPMFWVFEIPGSYWALAEVDALRSTGERLPVQFETPQLYMIKSFATDGSATMSDCYMPFDVNNCLTDQPFNTTLIYCPYSFKDSLKNPWVDHVVVFHNIGLDRLVNSYRNPVVVNRTVEYISCPGTRQIMDLDNITSSVVVSAGGSLTFQNMIMQGSKSQNKTDWPSNLPLLLSTFKPIQTGTVILRDSSVRVRNINLLIQALQDLPNGSTAAVETPNLQPTYSDPPRIGEPKFTIKLWQLEQQRFLMTRVGGNAILDKLGSSGMARWQFFNVTVGNYQPVDCFGAACVQGSALPGSYSIVRTGQELVDQLANVTARYIRVDNDIKLPGGMGQGQVTVNRIVEVRSCHPGGTYTVDWNRNHDAVTVSGTAIFEGDMVMAGIGWSDPEVHDDVGQVVDALHPVGLGTVEYEDLTLIAEMTPNMWQNDTGYSHISELLGVKTLDDNPLNMSLVHRTNLLLRGFNLNRSATANGLVGLESFLDVNLRWTEVQAKSEAAGVNVAAIVVPIVVGLALLALAAVLLVRRRSRKCKETAAAAAAAAATIAGKGGKDGLLPTVYADTRYDDMGSDTGAGIMARKGSTETYKSERFGSTASSQLAGRQKSGPSQDIVQACRNLVLRKTANEPEELVLQSVLGEGSYGKVFKATWKGTTVAVKIMILPSYMTGKEKREKMAVMETAISSSLSHPNVVQTFTYAVEPVRANTTLSERSKSTQGPGGSISMHDSTLSWGAQPNKAGSSPDGSPREGGSEHGGNAFSWEVRLVQEFCDLGSLRDALKQNRFRGPDGSVLMPLLVDTALDVARAMAHLHTHHILHSDLKARNVLLRSDAHDPRGFAAKVADFGLSLTIDPQSTHISNAFQGTMTHMAPETLMHGQVSRSSDVFGYGILLWELYTGDHAYKGVPRALLGHNITKQGLRPTFPQDTPFDWQFLACRCWETDPAIRPSFDQVLEELKRMKAKLSPPAAGSDAGSFISQTHSMPSSGSMQPPPVPALLAPLRVLSQQTLLSQQRLPSIEDASETLPTELDQALWEQQHQQTLMQQGLQRQDMQRQRSSGLTGLTPSGSAEPGGVTAGPSSSPPTSLGPSFTGTGTAGYTGGSGMPGYTGMSPAMAGLTRAASSSGVQQQQPSSRVPEAVWGSPLYTAAGAAGDAGDQAESPSYYVDGSSFAQQRMHNSNINSTMVGASSVMVLMSTDSSTM